MKCHRLKLCRAIFFCCLALWLVGVPWARGQSEHTAKLIEGAKKEGKLVWYTSMSISDAKPMMDAFKEKYPFVQTQVTRAGGDRIVNRLLNETRAGRWNFDVVSTGVSRMEIFLHNGLVSPYVSPESKAYGKQFKDQEGYWTGIFNLYYVIAYNTEMVPAAETPKDWEDLLDPKWKGKIAIDREEYLWYATLVSAWGKQKTQKYMESLAKQQIQWRRGHTLIAQLMAAGEFPVAIAFGHRIEDMKKKEAPLEWVDTLDPVVVSVHGIGLSAKPNNSNTAKLFVDFTLSKEGQEMIRSFNRIPSRSDVEPLSAKLDQTKLKLEVAPTDMDTRYDQYVQEFRDLFGL